MIVGNNTIAAGRRDPIAASLPFADWDVAQASVSGGVIDSIPDSRGGRTITGTSTERPAYSATDAGFNNRASSTGDSTNDRLITSAGTLSDWKFLHDGSGFELIAVMRRGASTIRPLLHTESGSSVNIGFSLQVNSSGNVSVIVGNSTVALAVTSSGLIGSGQTRVIGARYKESSSPKLSLYASGSEVANNSTWPSAGAPSSSNPTKALAVGNYRDTFDESCGAPWARIVIWNRELTTAERAAITAALNAKYGAS